MESALREAEDKRDIMERVYAALRAYYDDIKAIISVRETEENTRTQQQNSVFIVNGM